MKTPVNYWMSLLKILFSLIFFGASFSNNIFSQPVIDNLRVSLFQHIDAYYNKYFELEFNANIVDPLGLSNIKSVTVLSPQGKIYTLYDNGNSNDNSANDGIYGYRDYNISSPNSGICTFQVINNQGITITATDSLTEAIGFFENLQPNSNCIVSSDSIVFTWKKIKGIDTYRFWIGDKNGAGIWSIDTPDTSVVYNFSDWGRTLDEGETFQWRVSVDSRNNHSWTDNFLFCYSTNPTKPIMNSLNCGLNVNYTENYDNNNNYWLDVSVNAIDPQGPTDIDSVWIDFPNKIHFLLYDDNTHCDEKVGDSRYRLCTNLNSQILSGTYTLFTKDKSGNMDSLSGSMPYHINYPVITAPLNNSYISNPNFSITWKKIEGVSNYVIDVFNSDGMQVWHCNVDSSINSINYNQNLSGQNLTSGKIYDLWVSASVNNTTWQTMIKFVYGHQGPVFIDGSNDAFWTTATGHIQIGQENIVWGKSTDDNDCSADLYLAYDSLFLYGLIEVKDNTIGDVQDWWWDNDAMALNFDFNPSTLASQQNTSDIYSLQFTARNDAQQKMSGYGNMLYSRSKTTNGYTVEFAVPSTNLINTSPNPDEKLLLKEGTKSGFLFQLADEDDINNSTGREAEFAWGHEDVNVNSFNNVSQYGSITFLANNQVQISHTNLAMDSNNPFICNPNIYSYHFKNSDSKSYWHRHFYVHINDQQGLTDIDSVWVTFPKGGYCLLYDDKSHCDSNYGDGLYENCFDTETPYDTGAYKFYVLDKSGYLSSIVYSLHSILDCPEFISPVNNSIITSLYPTISWREVAGATSYWLDLAYFENGNDNWFWHYNLNNTELNSIVYSGKPLEIGKQYKLRLNAGNDQTSSSTTINFIYRETNRQIIYVDKSNSSGIEDGSPDFPYSSIQKGINVSIKSDTVLVFPGIYFENIVNNGKNIVICSKLLTTGDTSYISKTIIDGNKKDNVVTLDNYLDSTAGLHGLTIQNGFVNGWGGGVKIWNHSSPELSNLVVKNNTAVTCGGIVIYSYCSPHLNNIKILNNTETMAGCCGGGALGCWDYSRPVIQNTLIAGNKSNSDNTAIVTSWVGSEATLNNVTIADNSCTNDVFVVRGTMNIKNSILWNNTPDKITNDIKIEYSTGNIRKLIKGNIYLNPLFVNPSIGDYHLQSASPCIDAGIPDTSKLNICKLDLDGNPRVVFNRIDMGAYESSIPGPPPDAPQNLFAIPGNSTVTLKWLKNKEPDILRYRIYSGVPPAQLIKIDSSKNVVSDTSIIIGNLKNGVYYYYRITAVDYAGFESNYSNDIVVLSGALSSVPYNLLARMEGCDYSDLKWQDTTNNENGFEIQRLTIGNDNFEILDTVNADITEYKDYQLNSNTKYYYRVRAFNDFTISEFTNQALITTPSLPDTRPIIYKRGGPNVYYFATTAQNVDYQWYYNGTPIPGANKYYYVAYKNYGSYFLEITQKGRGCPLHSNIDSVFDIDQAKAAQSEEISIYPNPAINNLFININNDYIGEIAIKLIDMTGRALFNTKIFKIEENSSDEIKLPKLAKGFYLLKLRIGFKDIEKQIFINQQ